MSSPRIPKNGTPASAPTSVTSGWMSAQREQEGLQRAMVEQQRDRARAPHQSTPDHGQDGEHHRDDAPEDGVREPDEPEPETDERPLDRGGEARADERGGRDVAEPLAQLLGVPGRERDVRSDRVPRRLRPEQQIEQPE